MADLEQRRAGTRLHYALLALVLIAGAWLRYVAIGRESLWADEALTLVLANWPTGETILQPTDPTPFLYYFLHKLLIPADSGAAAVRSISLVAGILSIGAIYAVGRLAFGRRAGLLAAALLAVWPVHIDYSQEARAYSPLFLLTLVSAAGLLWWFRESGRDEPARIGPVPARHIALALFAAATLLSFYTHLVAIFWIAAALQILISVSQRTKSKRHFGEVAVALAAMALLAIPGFIRFARAAATPDAFHWLAQEGPIGFLSVTADVLLPAGLSGAAKAAVGFGLVAGLALLFVRARRAGGPVAPEHLPAAAVICGFLALPLMLWLFGFAVRPLFMPRTILFAIPGMILLIVAAVGSLRSEGLRQAFAAVAIAAFALPLLLHGTVREKEDWRGADAALAARVRPGDLILICPGWKYPALRHAAQQPLPGAVLAPMGPVPLLLEQPFGSDPRWDRAYFASVTEPLVRLLRGGAAPSPHRQGHVAARPGAAIWLVDSECSDGEMAAIRAWLGGPGAWSSVWASPSGPDHAGIGISRYAAAGPAVREVLLGPLP